MVMDTQFLILFSVFIIYGPAYSSGQATWSYYGDTGPDFWSTLEGGEMCSGASQSPIDIQTDIAVEQRYDPWTSTGYYSEEGDGPRPVRITNTGTGAVVDLEGDYLFSGGGLPSTYRAFLMDIHWGSDDSKGSEHTKDGKQYPAEVHAAHYDTLKYESVEDAILEPEGITVFTWFVEIGEHNEAWDPFFNSLSEIKYVGSSTDLPFFKLADTVPDDFSKFYRYYGSRPAPPCQETIIWTILEPTIKMSAEQIAMLRNLSRFTEAEVAEGQVDLPLVDNWRPVQPLNTRTLYVGYADFAPWQQDDEDNCANRCGNEYDEMASCQCNSICRHYGDCCEDYMDNCLVEICTYVPTFKNKMRKQHPREMMDEMVDEPRPSTDTRTR